ncbi:type I inositol polyphosphate 5-phosphatase 4-like isoform X1 [Arachis ipaensis]|nr:type I inositol polyphosphate 5-phosphatase 4-like isoform X1 [Arachis ipaensis]
MQVLVGQMYYSGYGVPRDDQKGSVSVNMSLFHSCLCFVCSHLTSGQKDGAEQRRDADVNEIPRHTCFSAVLDSDQPQTIPSHEINPISAGSIITVAVIKRASTKLLVPFKCLIRPMREFSVQFFLKVVVGEIKDSQAAHVTNLWRDFSGELIVGKIKCF